MVTWTRAYLLNQVCHCSEHEGEGGRDIRDNERDICLQPAYENDQQILLCLKIVFGSFVLKFHLKSLKVLFENLILKSCLEICLEILFRRPTDTQTDRQCDFLKLLAGA